MGGGGAIDIAIEVQRFRGSEVQRFRSSEDQKIRRSEVQNFRTSELQIYIECSAQSTPFSFIMDSMSLFRSELSQISMVCTEIYSANRPCTENLIRYNMSIVVSVLDPCLFFLFVLLTICISILLPLCAVYGLFLLVSFSFSY